MMQNVNVLQSFPLIFYLYKETNNCAYKIVNKQMTDYLDENLFEDYILEKLYYDRIDISKGIDIQ